ncbi:hypothetical protein [Nonomuraea dietziae]|uniref:hypothetical protein n=1 Tax=Nonomuraea dietziae TaxID=65515 RepID=UPI0034024067
MISPWNSTPDDDYEETETMVAVAVPHTEYPHAEPPARWANPGPVSEALGYYVIPLNVEKNLRTMGYDTSLVQHRLWLVAKDDYSTADERSVRSHPTVLTTFSDEFPCTKELVAAVRAAAAVDAERGSAR